MALMKYIALVLICISAVTSDYAWGRCPKVTYPDTTFELNRYIGKWYEVARVNVPFQKGQCTQAEYSLNDDGTVKVDNNEQMADGLRKGAVGKAETTENSWVLQVSFGQSFFNKFFKGDYRVISTDYETYSVVYSCTDFVFARMEYVWILSRTPQVSAEKFENLTNIARRVGFTPERFRLTNQDAEFCHYEN